jgi:hypothetical protein
VHRIEVPAPAQTRGGPVAAITPWFRMSQRSPSAPEASISRRKILPPRVQATAPEPSARSDTEGSGPLGAGKRSAPGASRPRCGGAMHMSSGRGKLPSRSHSRTRTASSGSPEVCQAKIVRPLAEAPIEPWN